MTHIVLNLVGIKSTDWFHEYIRAWWFHNRTWKNEGH